MANWFNLILDTTQPQLEIYSPSYTSVDIMTEIIIKSNETMMNYQEIYIIDTIGVRHDFTFSFNGTDEFLGRMVLSNMSLGIVTLYCRLKDEVANTSALYSKAINLIESNKLIINLMEQTRNIKLAEEIMDLNLYEQTQWVKLVEETMDIDLHEQTRNIKIEVIS